MNYPANGFGNNPGPGFGTYQSNPGPGFGTYGQQQPYQAQQPSVILGRFVSSPGDIRPNDVPMDGSIGVFPANDMSCIVTKAWNSDGRIVTARYVRQEDVPEPQQKQAKDEFSTTVLDRLDKIEKSLNKLTKGSASKKEEG